MVDSDLEGRRFRSYFFSKNKGKQSRSSSRPYRIYKYTCINFPSFPSPPPPPPPPPPTLITLPSPPIKICADASIDIEKSHVRNSIRPGNQTWNLEKKIPVFYKLNLRYAIGYRFNLWHNSMFLTLSQTSPGFYVSVVKVFWKHCEKEEIGHNEQFLLFPQCFLPVWRTFCHFHQIWNCRLQTLSVSKSLKLIVWKRVNDPGKHGFGHIVGKEEENACNSTNFSFS